MKADKLIIGGTVVSKDSTYKANIGITDGKISHILAPDVKIDADEVVDVAGKYVIPGGIDAHVHFEDPGHTEREDFTHGTAACAVGGITTCILMPIHDPIILNLDTLKTSMDCYVNRGYVDYAIHGGLDASSLKDTRDLWEKSGIATVKVFMCQSSPNMGFVDDATLYEGLKLIADMNAIMTVHAENDSIIKLFEKKAHDAGRTDAMSYNESRPAFGEVEAVRRCIYFAKITGATVVFPHISTADALIEIHKAKEEGIKVYAESCGQYFNFVADDMKKYGPFLKFAPVMHEEDNKERMWDLLAKGYVDTIGSDHSPYLKEDKEKAINDIWKSPNGIPGIEVELAWLLDAVNSGKLTLENVVRMTSYNQSQIYHLPGKGQIQVGYDADIVVVDMNLEKEFSEKDIKAKNKWSPYIGRKFKGWPVMTFVRGTLVAKDGNLMINEGHSKYISRAK